MNAGAICSVLILWLMAESVLAQQGLKGEYYTGTNFERKVFTRIDRQLTFNWAEKSPGPGMPNSYYSIRWTGKLLAPATGQYRFYAKVDDGIRIWVDGQKLMDSWQLNDSKRYTSSIVLEAGRYYDLRIDYFNDMLEGELELYWQPPNSKEANRNGLPSQLVSGAFLFQQVPPNANPPKPTVKPPVVAVIPPKVTPKKAAPTTTKPVLTPPRLTPKARPDTTRKTPVPPILPTERPTGLEPDTTFNLRQRNIRFEQSSYDLLPDSQTELEQLVKVLKKHPAWRVNVAGYTDNVGDSRLNLTLSEYRAKVVASYLTQRGIADDRITTAGYGGSSPVADNATEEGRRENRRVVVKRE